MVGYRRGADTRSGLDPADGALLERLRQISLDVLGGVLGGRRDVVLLDVPRHRNLGDSLIWLGEVTYLTSLGCRIRYQADHATFREEDFARVPSDAVILFQGGGNLGDLWPAFEEFRRFVVQRYPTRTFVVLPQSIRFECRAAAAGSARTYAAADLTLLLRDRQSLESATRLFPEVPAAFCPDAAFGADVVRARRREGTVGGQDLLVLARDDVERSPADTGFEAGTDWRTSPPNRLAWRSLVRVDDFLAWPSHSLVRASAPLRQLLIRRALLLNCSAAVRQFESPSAVATNRLHAHILATLLGIPNFVSDNSYGKISGVLDYTSGFTTSHPCESMTEAVARAREYLSSIALRD